MPRSPCHTGRDLLWMQIRVVNDEAAQIARDAGIAVVQKPLHQG